MICCRIKPWRVMAQVASARHCALAEVTAEEGQDDGYAGRGEMLSDLQGFYPKLRMDSPATVIRWKDAQGKLVDAHRSV